MASVILGVVTERCPRLLKLSLLPSGAERFAAKDNDNELLGFLWRRPYQEYLRALPSLVELTCGSVIFEQGTLPIIASLPQLHRLVVMDSSFSIPPLSRTLPQGSFPALRRLHLRGVCAREAGVVLGMQPLMRGLTHIELKFNCGCLGDNRDEDPDKVIVVDLLSLLKHSPCLSSLEFNVDPENLSDGGYDIGHQPLLDIFAKLPLESITSYGLQFGMLLYSDGAETVWTNMTTLRMESQAASPITLLYLAQMLPKIQYLKLIVELHYFGGCPDVTFRSPLQVLECSPGSSIVIEPKALEPAGRFFRALFPDLRKVVWTEDPTDNSPNYRARKRFVGFLNKHLALRRELEELKARAGL